MIYLSDIKIITDKYTLINEGDFLHDEECGRTASQHEVSNIHVPLILTIRSFN